MNWLRKIDIDVFLALNDSGGPMLDFIMIWLSDKYIWFPLYALIIFLLYRAYGRKVWVPLIGIALLILFTDQLTSSIMKPLFERLRPCHDPSLAEMVSVVDKCGGKYGFASSHAANTMGLAVFLFSALGKHWIRVPLLVWAFLVGYSRIYLGVHFPGDVLTGFAVGILGAVLSWRLSALMLRRFSSQ